LKDHNNPGSDADAHNGNSNRRREHYATDFVPIEVHHNPSKKFPASNVEASKPSSNIPANLGLQ
jgi:hypothetical protein